jgi:hypothetical protein
MCLQFTVIHRQYLVAKKLSDRLHNSLQTVITAVNTIKSQALNDRLFWMLCDENDEHFERLLLQTEVRWLSKGNCIRRFYDLFDSVVEFFERKNSLLSEELRVIRHDVAYLSDLLAKFNEINVQLQGNEINLIKAKSVISTFVSKLVLFKRNLGRRELYRFSSLSGLDEKSRIHADDLQVYCDHLSVLHEDMTERFKDLLSMEIPDWVINPFSDIGKVEVLEEELLDRMCWCVNTYTSSSYSHKNSHKKRLPKPKEHAPVISKSANRFEVSYNLTELRKISYSVLY